MPTRPKREFDVVKGKGQGLVILLHGAPGVGKTSTAECVAVHAGRPLLAITSGDLGGSNARHVEKHPEGFFYLARKWECVLLLDEADVFVGARDKGDFQQIMLVSGKPMTQGTPYYLRRCIAFSGPSYHLTGFIQSFYGFSSTTRAS